MKIGKNQDYGKAGIHKEPLLVKEIMLKVKKLKNGFGMKRGKTLVGKKTIVKGF